MKRWTRTISILLLFLTALALPSAASAAPAQLWEAPEGGPANGSGAGELHQPLGVAVSPVSGHVFVPDRLNARIDEFTAWGEFVKAFGWKVDASDPEDKLQTCTAETGCLAGTEGAGAGQLDRPEGLAFDGEGNLYVVDLDNHRVQKFGPEGEFILMFGGEVDQDTNANLCTAASGHICGIGKAGTANGQFGAWPTLFVGAQFIATGPGDEIHVGDVDRIQVFDKEGTYLSQLALPKAGEAAGAPAEGKGAPEALAIDPAGNLYMDFNQNYNLGGAKVAERPNIYKHNGTSWSLFAETAYPKALATDEQGNLYAVDKPYSDLSGNPGVERIIEFDAAGNRLIPSDLEVEENEGKESNQLNFFGQKPLAFEIKGLATSGGACGIPGGGLYVGYLGAAIIADPNISSLLAYGSTPDPELCPPPVRPPAITDQYASAVGAHEATLRAKINSRFWTTTTYYVEYGTEPCSLGGCEKRPLPPGTPLNSKTNSAITTPNVFIPGLQAGTTYHYRFVAKTVYEPGPGGEAEVKGLGSDGAEGEFTTLEPALPLKQDCANQGFRTGSSAALSDCRAYEMVSPVDKEGGEIVALQNLTGFLARLSQSSVTGDKVTYSAFRPFGGAESAPTSSQYIASRNSTGWSNEAINPPFGRSLVAGGSVGIDRQFKLFSPNLCQGWMRLDFQAPEPPLDPAAVPDQLNLYSRDNCGGGGYEALTTLVPPHQVASNYIGLELQGTSADGSTAIYLAKDSLPGTEAPPQPQNCVEKGLGCLAQLYIRSGDGTTRYVCMLPNGTPSGEQCYAGNAGAAPLLFSGQGRKNPLTGAISTDGSRVFFTTGEGSVAALYLRTNATQPQSAIEAGQCSEEEMACTIAIPQAKTFWAAAADGSRVLFTTAAGALREYEVEEGTVTPLAASGALGVLGQSSDATRVYFAASSVLAPGATLGKPNLYFREVGEPVRFVATLAGEDLNLDGLSKPAAITPEPNRRTARVSPDGLHAAFLSRAPLTGYDNTDAQNGEALGEVFHYDATGGEAGEGSLVCVSCDPSGARQVGRVGKAKPWEETRVAAWVPTWESSLYPSNALSSDGSRLFFNSYVPLVGRDSNGKQDVYEWRSAESKAECEAQGAERYVPSSEGCLSLISSGESVLDSEFLDANPSGRDVFFATGASLLTQDPDLIDVYDAREGGGLPPPPGPPAPCEGEACQSPPEAPNDPTPASSSAEGAGNVREAPSKPRCAKGKARRKGRCVKAASKQQKRNRTDHKGSSR